jgi:protein-L-isoaspartate(D-aspartate) O-methyltransferase
LLCEGGLGWPELAPFDAFIFTAAGAALDAQVLAQLAEGGTLVAPVGGPLAQNLVRVRKTAEGLVSEDLGKVVFVPLVSGII